MMDALFSVGEFRTERLESHRDSASVQALIERCADYVAVVEGRPPGPNAAEEFFAAAPDGWTPEQVDKLGVRTGTNSLVGLIESVRGYPRTGTTHLGLMLLAPDVRGVGLGAALFAAYTEWCARLGATHIRLGVVADNRSALRFWSRLGFTDVARKPPEQMGTKHQAVHVMELDLAEVGRNR